MYNDFKTHDSKVFGDQVKIIRPDTFKDERGWEGKYYQDEDIMRKTGTVTVIR